MKRIYRDVSFFYTIYYIKLIKKKKKVDKKWKYCWVVSSLST